MNKKIVSILLFTIVMILSLTGCSLKDKNNDTTTQSVSNEEDVGTLSSTEDINLYDVDGRQTNYLFTYKGEVFSAKYTKDNWKIKDSYKITNAKDIGIICQALIEVHPIHGKDMKSYRTVDDLVYEWQQHNLAYNLLPDDNSWKSHAKDVDLDPADQGRNLAEIYEARTGEKLNMNKLKNSKKLQRVKNSSTVEKIENKIKSFLK